MVKDHNKIEKLLNNLEEKNNENFDSMRTAFNKFEWELEKHIFTEEKAIFTSYHPEDINEGYKMLPELTKQHNFILNKLNNWREDIRNKRIISAGLFQSVGKNLLIIKIKNYIEEKMKVLEVENISKTFAALKAVDQVSFEIEEGVSFGLLGPNGAGKTTTIRMITNIKTAIKIQFFILSLLILMNYLFIFI